MTRIFDALEICLQELENGENMETVLAHFPELAGELRPILKTSLAAKNMSAPEPSADTVRRGRARLMQRASELRMSRVTPRKRVIPAFQRLALSFALTATLLLSGTGLVNASASALPGENLYPVKRTWEDLRLLLIFNKEARKLMEYQYEGERLHEVNELLVEGRHEAIQFAGVFMQVNGVTYISGVPVILPPDVQLPANGAAVLLTGQTNAQGLVEIISIELLPNGSIVPVGKPVIAESGSDSGSEAAPGSGSSNEALQTESNYYEMDGTLQSVSTTTLVINDLTVYLDNALIKGELCSGITVEVKGYFAKDARFLVTEVETDGSCPAGNSAGNGTAESPNHDDEDQGHNDGEDD